LPEIVIRSSIVVRRRALTQVATHRSDEVILIVDMEDQIDSGSKNGYDETEADDHPEAVYRQAHIQDQLIWGGLFEHVYPPLLRS
jgi:hypothetical protein